MAGSIKHVVEYIGVHRTAVWVPDQSNNYRGRVYYLARSDEDRARLRALIERQCDLEIGIRDKTKFRHEGSGIWAFKRYQDRLFCYVDGRFLCITHGLRKKQDKLPRSALLIAKSIRDHNRSEGNTA